MIPVEASEKCFEYFWTKLTYNLRTRIPESLFFLSYSNFFLFFTDFATSPEKYD